MTEILESTDIDLTVLIDFESDRTCDMPGCDLKAVYRVSQLPCRCETLLICAEKHYENTKKWDEFLRIGLVKRRCSKCKTSYIGLEIIPI